MKIDYLSILGTQSTTGKCDAMITEVNRQLDLIPNLVRETDDYGNLYVTKGKADAFPAFVCHLDTVHKIYNSFVVQVTDLNYAYAYSQDEGFQTVGVGGDDKSGIIACLELLTKLKYVKCAFFLDEEQGCKGSAAGNLNFFDDCRYAIQIDRKGNSDIITKGSGTQLCSKEFEDFMTELGKTYGYAPTTGASTDVVKLKDRGLKISACNLSAGYYNPHTKQEYIDLDDLNNCINFCLAIAKIKTVYPHVLPPPVQYTKSKSSSSPTTSSLTTTRKCTVCNDVLGWNFGVICNACVRRNLVLTLSDTGEAVVTQTAFEECKGCGAGLYTPDEVSKEFCYGCRFCSDCGETLEHKWDISVGQCTQCWWLDQDNEVNICQTPSCASLLLKKAEKITGFCDGCVVWETPPLCSSTACVNDLVTDTEIENGMCADCMAEFNS